MEELPSLKDTGSSNPLRVFPVPSSVSGKFGNSRRSDSMERFSRSRSLWTTIRVARVGFFLLSFTSVLGTARILADEPDGSVRVARLVKLLGSDSFSQRQAASAQLLQLGRASQSSLETAIHSDNPEIRLRAESLLRQLKINQLWSPSSVRFQTEDDLVSKVLADLARQSGNHVVLGGQFETFHETKVKLANVFAPYWKMVDEVCRQSDNHVRSCRGKSGRAVAIIAGPPGQYPVSYAGPLRVQIIEARRKFSQTLNYEELTPKISHTFEFDLEIMWEDRFHLLAYQSEPELVEAVTDTNVRLTKAPGGFSGWNVLNHDTSQLEATLRLRPPPTSARKLSTLKLKWDLIAVCDMASIEIPIEASSQVYRQDDVELKIESIEKRSEVRYVVTLMVSRNLIIPKPEDVMFLENKIELFGTAGQALDQKKKGTQTTPQAFTKASQSNQLIQQGARMEITFIAPSPKSKPTLLRFTYPRIRDRKQIEIIFHDVPLPAAQLD